ncbi:hypothetical protein EMEDMD4_1340004 [Sinorhizobium medicae]|uniref:Uncharacterized protein n=1 Tax=Sinorhizobium medicae TaxID=110321 RepID=A0A508WRL4_9HYPH|nr:hypothetical protein EMEDMD4_1340004 [Sinorhizobium medicae]
MRQIIGTIAPYPAAIALSRMSAMIFGTPPTFADVIASIEALEHQLNNAATDVSGIGGTLAKEETQVDSLASGRAERHGHRREARPASFDDFP